MVNSLHNSSAAGRSLSIDSADLELPGEPEKARRSEGRTVKPTGDFGRVLDLFREALGARVESVRESKRLTDSPMLPGERRRRPEPQLQRLLKANNRDVPVARSASSKSTPTPR